MTLRSALELLFTGIYFQGLEDEGKKEELKREWQRWSGGKKSNLFGKGKDYSGKEGLGLLDQKAKEDAGRLYGEFSKAVHGLAQDEFEEIFVKDKKAARPASAFFEQEFLERWFEDFLRAVVIMRDILLSLPLKLKQRGTKGLKLLESITKTLEGGERGALAFVDCPWVRQDIERNRGRRRAGITISESRQLNSWRIRTRPGTFSAEELRKFRIGNLGRGGR